VATIRQLDTFRLGAVPPAASTRPSALALLANTADQNTATGAGALLSNTTGTFNTATGAFALFSNTTGNDNAASGETALFSNSSGGGNTAMGRGALYGNTTANGNTAFGSFTLYGNTTGIFNTAVGASALPTNTTGNDNTAVGLNALFGNNGDANTVVGRAAMSGNTSGGANAVLGWFALAGNTTRNGNTAVGDSALVGNTTGSNNVALGIGAGLAQTDGNWNVYIGEAVAGIAGEFGTTRIRNIGSTPIGGGVTVVVDGTGGIGDQKLGYLSSSRRYKEDIKPIVKTSKTLFDLKPVSFRAKGDPARVRHYGLIAEDVAKINPDLAVYNPQGQPETVRYDAVNTMLLNEFLKEHKKVEEQQATIAELKSTVVEQRKDFEAISAQQHKEIQALTASFKEQASQIQKVTTQLEMGEFATGRIRRAGPAPQVVVNNP
jgi:trimeric autotransporter adhesin